jgi:hypothetical protein
VPSPAGLVPEAAAKVSARFGRGTVHLTSAVAAPAIGGLASLPYLYRKSPAFPRKTPKFHQARLFFVEMTLCEFNLLPYERQLVAVFTLGTFLAHRTIDEDAINLYHLPGDFFVEVYYNTHTGQVLLLQSFTSTMLLENYTSSIELPQD